MRSSLVLLAGFGFGFGACAQPGQGPTCESVTSFATPVYRCAATPPPAEPPAPAPEAPPAPTPAPAPKAVMREDKIELSETIEFETDSDRLLPNSEKVLDEVIAILKGHPELKKVRIEGYTDSTSTREHNQTLSEQRAAAVKTYLVDHGIDGGRLTTKGFGQDHPVASNDTEEGRHQNRRVDFKLLR